MPVIVTCANCQTLLDVPDEYMNMTLACPTCGHNFTPVVPKQTSPTPILNQPAQNPQQPPPPAKRGFFSTLSRGVLRLTQLALAIVLLVVGIGAIAIYRDHYLRVSALRAKIEKEVAEQEVLNEEIESLKNKAHESQSRMTTVEASLTEKSREWKVMTGEDPP